MDELLARARAAPMRNVVQHSSTVASAQRRTPIHTPIAAIGQQAE
jgi:hypothetical protein